MRAHEFAVGHLDPRLRMLREALLRVLLFLRTLLMVSLCLRERVPGNRNRQLVYRRYLCLSTTLFYISYTLGKIAYFFIGGGVNGK